MNNLHENQKKILDYLLKHPEGATVDDLTAHLGVTKTAVKEHLLKIHNYGYITYEDEKGSVGRPKRHYFLTSEGHEAFPRQYSWLSNVLLAYLADTGGKENMVKVMKNVAVRVADSMKSRFLHLKNPELLKEVTKVLSELGYRAVLKQSDLRKGAVIEATNCVYHSVAKEHPELCQFDIQFIKEATGMDVKLESCIARGGVVCRFCIKKHH